MKIRFDRLFLDLTLACSLTSPVFAQFNDPILDGASRDRQRQHNQLESNSIYLQEYESFQRQQEQRTFINTVGIGVLVLIVLGGVITYGYKKQSESKKEKSLRKKM